MSLKVYKSDISPPSRAVMMTCDMLKLPVELIDVNLPTREHFAPDFLKKNPVHTVPVLEDDGFIIIDSHAILMYLVDKYGQDDSLYPTDLEKRTLVNQKLFFDTGILFPRLKSMIVSVFYDRATSLAERQLRDIHEAYGFLEEFLRRSKYLASDSITLADISAIADVTTIAYVVPLDAKKYPKTAAWVEDLEKKPYCQKFNASGSAILGDVLKRAFNNV